MVNVNDITDWRERTFSSLLSVVLVVGAISTVAIMPVLVKQGLWPVALADSSALLWTYVIWRLERPIPPAYCISWRSCICWRSP
jgi:hypothetical protein